MDKSCRHVLSEQDCQGRYLRVLGSVKHYDTHALLSYPGTRVNLPDYDAPKSRCTCGEIPPGRCGVCDAE